MIEKSVSTRPLYPLDYPVQEIKSPVNYALNTVIEDDRKPRIALTEEQEEKLLSFVENDKSYRKYFDVIVLLLKTGLRISELCGLTVSNLDFENRLINVDHQLLRNEGSRLLH